MKKQILGLCAFSLAAVATHAQVNFSGGLSYSQNFDSLANSGTSTPWSDNTTLVGWYAQSTNATIVTGDYRVDNGGLNTGDLYSYGATGSPERALGSICSGTSATIGYGLRLQNDTANVLGNISLSYTGEQWRNGGNTSAQPISFSYRFGSSPITGPDVPGAFTWISVAGLTFTSPVTGSLAAALDGNAAANRTSLSAILTGVTLNPGDELFIRWIDFNDAGNDHGLAIDDLNVTAAVVPEPSTFALLGLSVAGFLAHRRRKA